MSPLHGRVLPRQIAELSCIPFPGNNGHNCCLSLLMTTSHTFSSSSAFWGMPPQLHGRPNSLGKRTTSYHVDMMVNLALHSHVFTLVACIISHYMRLPLQKGSTLSHMRKVTWDIYPTHSQCRKVVT